MTSYFQRLNDIFHGIIAGPLVAFSFLYLEYDSGNLTPPFGERDYWVESGVLFVITLIYLVWIFKYWKVKLKLIDRHQALDTKLKLYSKKQVQFYMLVTLPGVVAVVLMYLTGELSFSLIYLLELFLLSLRRPTEKLIIRDLDLQGEEKEIVLKKKELQIKG